MEHPSVLEALAAERLAVEKHRTAVDAEEKLEAAIRDTTLAPEVRDGFEADVPRARERRLRASAALGEAKTRRVAASTAAAEPWKAHLEQQLHDGVLGVLAAFEEHVSPLVQRKVLDVYAEAVRVGVPLRGDLLHPVFSPGGLQGWRSFLRQEGLIP